MWQDYQSIVDAEWKIIYNKLEAIAATGAKVVLSRLPIGDLATQYFADRDIFCAGRVANDDLKRVVQAVGGQVQSTTSDIRPEHIGTCDLFEERQIGGERYNIFEGCPKAKTATMLLRGGAEQFIAEVERSLHDAIMIVKRAIKNNQVVAGGGATEMEISKFLRDKSRTIEGKQQAIMAAFAKSLEIIPRQLCDNAGIDATDVLNKLRMLHARGEMWAGVDIESEGVANNMEKFVWEPSLVKINALSGATEAACLILRYVFVHVCCSRLLVIFPALLTTFEPYPYSVDETVRNAQSEKRDAGPQMPRGGMRGAVRGRGRGRGR